MLVFMPLAAWVGERWGWRLAPMIPSVGAAISWLAGVLCFAAASSFVAVRRPQPTGAG